MSAARPDTGPTLVGARVAVVNWRDLGHPDAGGSEHYAWHLVRALRDGGADVELLTARGAGQARREVVDGVRVERAGGRFGYYPRTLLRLLRRRRRLDLVIDPSCGIPTFSPLVLRRRTPVVLVVHHVHQDQFGTYFPRPLAALGRFLEGPAMRRAYRRATTLAVSGSTAEEMRHRLGWRGPIGLLENGVEPPCTAAVAGPAATHRPAEPGRVAVLGRLVEHKRVDAVVRAFAGLVADPAGLPDRVAAGLHLDLVGTGPEADRLAVLVEDLGLADRVRLHGFVTETRKSELLARASLHVCASDAEGWGQVVVEAAAHGRPTLARDVPGLRSSIRPDETGWLLPEPAHGDHASSGSLEGRLEATLEQGLRTALAALDDDEVAARFDLHCRDHAARHTWSAMHERTRAVALAALGRAPLPPGTPAGTPLAGTPLAGTAGRPTEPVLHHRSHNSPR